MKLTHALALLVVLSFVACAPATATPAPQPTLPPPPATPVPQPTPPPAAAATASPSPTAQPPTPESGPAPVALPAGAVALYAAGPWESLELFALAADGTSTDLGLQVAPQAVASPGGRWVAYLDSAKPGGARNMIVRRLQDGHTYTIPIEQPGVEVITAPAFDGSETHLAFVEVLPYGPEGVPWAIALVDLQDGSTRRFRGLQPQGLATQLPGTPLGWSAGGEFLLNTFVPYSEGVSQGLEAIALPGSGTLAIDALPSRQLLSGSAYILPRLSPDGTRLLYLRRDPGYTPADYLTVYMDLAVNQLWSLDIAASEPTRLAEVTDGGAFGPFAWSPGGDEVLFTQGRYAGNDELGSIVLKAWAGGAVRELGPLPLPGESYPSSLYWVAPGLALAVASLPGGTMELYTVGLSEGGVTQVAEAPCIEVLGCPR